MILHCLKCSYPPLCKVKKHGQIQTDKKTRKNRAEKHDVCTKCISCRNAPICGAGDFYYLCMS